MTVALYSFHQNHCVCSLESVPIVFSAPAQWRPLQALPVQLPEGPAHLAVCSLLERGLL